MFNKRITSLILVVCVFVPQLNVFALTKDTAEINKPVCEERVLLEDGFERSAGKANKILTGYSSPAEWTFEDSRNPADYELGAGITTSEKASGNSSLAIEAVDKNSAGFISPKVYITNETPSFDIAIKIKNSVEYTNNCPKYVLNFYWDDKLVRSTVLDGLSTSSDEWVENITHVDYSSYPYVEGSYKSTKPVEFNNIRVKLVTAYDGVAGKDVAGTLYFDDITITEVYGDSYSVVDIRCDDEAGCYNLGESVVFKPQKELPDAIYQVDATVHNSYGEVVYETSLSTSDFQNKGFVYTPERYGFYSVAFKGHTPYGELDIVSAWTWPHNTKPGTFVIPERSFVVLKETKPIEERNKKLTYASHYPGLKTHRDMPDNWELVYELHDIIGFGGLRILPFAWAAETFNAYKSPNPGKGLHDWTDTDKFMKMIKKYGFDVWASVLYTPDWASRLSGYPAKSNKSITDTMSTLPTRIEYYTEYLTQVADRYGDDIKIWEIWNETNQNNVFLSNATPEEYVYLLKHGYNHLKEIQPEDKVIMGGMVKADSGYYGKLLDAGLYDYTDEMVMHNKYTDWYAYQAEETKRGYEVKPWSNGEAHYNLFDMNDDDLDLTERQLALELLKGYFWDLRGGVETIALFQLDTDFDYECLPYMMSINYRAQCFGLFRKRPFLEPRISAIALHTFFDHMGKDFKFTSEHRFDSGTVAIRFENDGKPFVALWNKDQDAEFPQEIKACITDKTTMVDWENNPVAFDEKVRKDTVYFIHGLDAAALGSLPKADTSVVESLRRKVEKQTTHVADGNPVQLFDEKTFVPAENINWIDTGWQWLNKTAGEEQDDFAAKFAVSLNEKGLYVMVEVEDNAPYFENDRYDVMYNYDSVQIALDVTGEGYSDMLTEIEVSMLGDEVTVYKRESANVFAAIPMGWTGGGSTMNSENARVTVTPGKITYMVFVPATEMFPFKYDPNDKEWRMCLVVNDNDGKGRRGLLKWADGWDGGRNVGKFGSIILP